MERFAGTTKAMFSRLTGLERIKPFTIEHREVRVRRRVRIPEGLRNRELR